MSVIFYLRMSSKIVYARRASVLLSETAMLAFWKENGQGFQQAVI